MHDTYTLCGARVPQIFWYYTEKSSGLMGFDELNAFAMEFSVLPKLVSKGTLFHVYHTISADLRPVLFPGFVECIGRVAIMGLESMADKYPTVRSRIESFLERLRGSPKLDVISKEAHERGMGEGTTLVVEEGDPRVGRPRRVSDSAGSSPSTAASLLHVSRRRQSGFMRAVARSVSPQSERGDGASVDCSVVSSVASSGIMAALMDAAWDDSLSMASGASRSSLLSGGSRSLRRRTIAMPRLPRPSSLPPLSRRTSWSAASSLASPDSRGAGARQDSRTSNVTVSAGVAQAVAAVIVPEYSVKLTGVFEFYSRLGGGGSVVGGEVAMPLSNFTRLAQDCAVVDDVVSLSAIDVQVRAF